MSSSCFTKLNNMVKINKVSLIKVQSGILLTTPVFMRWLFFILD